MLSREIGLQRLMNMRILGEQFQTPQEVVKAHGAMQAQDYKQSLWAIGARMQGLGIQDLESAIEAGTILRTWAMRGTIHWIPAEDTQWILDLCASRILAGHGRRMRELALDEATMAKSERIFREAFRTEKAISRANLLQLLEAAGLSTEGQRGYHILWHLGHQGTIAIGPMLGTEQSFVLLDDFVGKMRELSREEALTELVRRYFASHAPATEQDFARWSGLTLGDTRRGIQSLQPELRSREINGMKYYGFEDIAIPTSERPLIHLLAAYDEFILGYKDRDTVLPAEHAQKVVPGNNGVFQPIVLVDGEVVGIWKRELKPKVIEIVFYPFTSFGDLDSQILAEAEKYAQFMGLPLSMRIEQG